MKLHHVRYSRPLGRVEADMNQVIDAVNSCQIAPGLNYRVQKTSNGTKLEIQAPPAQTETVEGASVTQYKLTAISDDYIEGKTWDGTTLGETAIRIAKPWRLRKTPFDGQTVVYNFNGSNISIRYTYQATPGYRAAAILTAPTATENQAIIPIYKVDDIIYATEPENGTLVTVSQVALTWLDVNVDGRAWARF